MIIRAIKQGFRTLNNPETEFRNMHKKSFETILGEYLILLLSVAIVAAIISFLYYLSKAFYLDIFQTLDVEYARMLNYSLGRSTSLMFFYLFAGTFFVFIFSLILMPFFRKLKYTRLLSIMFYSMTPFLLFSWIPALSIAPDSI